MIILKVKSMLNINGFVGKKIADCGNNTPAIWETQDMPPEKFHEGEWGKWLWQKRVNICQRK